MKEYIIEAICASLVVGVFISWWSTWVGLTVGVSFLACEFYAIYKYKDEYKDK